MKPIVVGNWKSCKNFELFNKIPSDLKYIEIAVALPYIYIPQTANYRKDFVALTAQDCSRFECGAYTGEIPASFLKENHVKYVIIGHSERRINLHEKTDALLDKINNALAAGLKVIYCIGENSLERQNKKYLKVLYDQFFSVVGQGIEIDIAYEPIWSIGTGVIPKEEEISEVIDHIQKWSKGIDVTGRILYGGSVSYENVEYLQKIKGVNGFLIGSCSLKDEFIDICEKYNEYKSK